MKNSVEKFDENLIDNRDGRFLYKAFELYSDSKTLKIGVGYFYASGFDCVKDHLQKIDKIQMVIGIETDRETAQQIASGYEDKIADNLLQDVEGISDDEQGAILEKLHDFVTQGKLDIRVYTKSKFHAKAYIFEGGAEDIAIIGSSNFSRRGLGIESSQNYKIPGNTELNSIHSERRDRKSINTWFDRIWAESEPYKDGILKIIENLGPYVRHRVGDPEYVSPIELFQTMVYEYSKDETLQTDDTLAEFQKIGVYNAINKIDKYGGCIVADSVGLGKTLIGLALIRRALQEGKNVLIIIPKHVESNWRMEINTKSGFEELNEKLRDGSISIMTINKLSALNYLTEGGKTELENMRAKYDFVVIDEAHRFRNHGELVGDRYRGNKNYANLILLKKQNTKHVLLTATPLNNSVQDLENLINIFTDDTTLKNNDSSLRFESFKKYRGRLNKIRDEHPESDADQISSVIRADHELGIHKDSIMKILEEVMILRTRTSIAEKYPNLEIGGKKLMTEAPIINAEKYEPSETLVAMYGSVGDLLKDLRMPHITSIGNKQAAMNLSGLFRVFLFKRLESSINSFVKSLENLEEKERSFLHDVDKKGFAFARKKFMVTSDNLMMDHDDELTAYMEELGDDIEDNQANEESKEKIIKDINHDLEKIDKFMNTYIRKIRRGKYEYDDPKLNKLKFILQSKSGMKILIFSQYIDTIEYVHQNLKGQLTDKTIDCVVGASNREIGTNLTTIEKIKRFAPIANKINPGETEIDILLATDTLSEGVNLQDCSIVINYDLPWNPMRITQRVGRIDRIGSLDRTVVYNIQPDEKLDVFLRLLQLLAEKISNIANIVGKENHILSEDEDITIKTIGERIKKLRNTKEYKDYDDVGRNTWLGKFSVKSERGEIILELRCILSKHGICSLQPKERNVYSIARHGDAPVTFVMFQVYDGRTHTKLKNSIMMRHVSNDNYDLIDMNHECVLRLPESSGITKSCVQEKTFSLDMEVRNIEDNFTSTELQRIKESYQVTQNAPSNQARIVEKIITKLDSIANMQSLASTDNNNSVEQAKKLSQVFKSHNIPDNTLRDMRAVLGDSLSLTRERFVEKVGKFYRQYMEGRPEFSGIRRDIDIEYKIVCRGAFI